MSEKTFTLPPLDEAYLEETLLQLLAIPSPVGLTDAIVRYVVDPKQAGSVKSRLIAVMLERLNAQPERVRFPKGDNR